MINSSKPQKKLLNFAASNGFSYRSWVKGKGVPHEQLDGRPVIGTCNTFSELTPCGSHFRTIA